jgi:hypothetical protein
MDRHSLPSRARARAGDRLRPWQIEAGRLLRKPRVDLLVALACRIGLERQHFAAAVDDGELVDQSLELGDEVGRDEDGAITNAAILNAPIRASWVRCPFERWLAFCRVSSSRAQIRAD